MPGADLREAVLAEASFVGANLRDTQFAGAELRGVQLDGANLEDVYWGPRMRLHYEEEADELARTQGGVQARATYDKAEEVYRALRRAYDAAGLRDLADLFHRRAMIMRRKQIPRTSMARWWSWLVDLSSGYGVIPQRVIIASLVIVVGNALLFFFAGLENQGNILRFSLEASLLENLEEFVLCMYFSMVTFTTIGYGDIRPLGLSRLFGSIEGFLGVFLAALFVATFSQKMLR